MVVPIASHSGGHVTLDVWWFVCMGVANNGEANVMQWTKRNWWVVAAGLMAALQVFGGVGNLEDDGGPLYGRVAFLSLTVIGAVLVATGIPYRNRDRSIGSTLIGVGVLPSAAGILLFWFPPAVLYGILAIVVAVVAFRDASAERILAEA